MAQTVNVVRWLGGMDRPVIICRVTGEGAIAPLSLLVVIVRLAWTASRLPKGVKSIYSRI